MATEQEKQNARAGGYEVLLVGKGTYDTYMIYLHGTQQAGEFGSLEDAWNHAVSMRQAELYNH